MGRNRVAQRGGAVTKDQNQANVGHVTYKVGVAMGISLQFFWRMTSMAPMPCPGAIESYAAHGSGSTLHGSRIPPEGVLVAVFFVMLKINPVIGSETSVCLQFEVGLN